MAKTKSGGDKTGKRVEALNHPAAKRKDIPTAEYQSAAEQMEEIAPVKPAHYARATPLTHSNTVPPPPCGEVEIAPLRDFGWGLV